MRTGRYEHKITLGTNGYITVIKEVLDCTEDLELITDNGLNGIFIMSMFQTLCTSPIFKGDEGTKDA